MDLEIRSSWINPMTNVTWRTGEGHVKMEEPAEPEQFKEGSSPRAFNGNVASPHKFLLF
jgi:hypothetical protein